MRGGNRLVVGIVSRPTDVGLTTTLGQPYTLFKTANNREIIYTISIQSQTYHYQSMLKQVSHLLYQSFISFFVIIFNKRLSQIASIRVRIHRHRGIRIINNRESRIIKLIRKMKHL